MTHISALFCVLLNPFLIILYLKCILVYLIELFMVAHQKNKKKAKKEKKKAALSGLQW